MATITAVKQQSDRIRKLVYKLQDTLKSNQLIQYFRDHPEQTKAILTASEGLETQRLVLAGLREALQSEVLPPISTLLSRAQDWLDEGDIIAGWAPGLTESENSPHPSLRVVQGITDDGYAWRFLDEEDAISRNPVQYDAWFQHPGWQKVGEYVDLEENLEEIHDLQQIEIDGLLEQITYFENRSFLNEA